MASGPEKVEGPPGKPPKARLVMLFSPEELKGTKIAPAASSLFNVALASVVTCIFDLNLDLPLISCWLAPDKLLSTVTC